MYNALKLNCISETNILLKLNLKMNKLDGINEKTVF